MIPPSVIRAAAAIVVIGFSNVAPAGILDADTLRKGTYRSACFTVW